MKSESYRWKIYFFRTNNEIFETGEKIEKIRFILRILAEIIMLIISRKQFGYLSKKYHVKFNDIT